MKMTTATVDVTGTCPDCGTLNKAKVRGQGVPGVRAEVEANATCGKPNCSGDVRLSASPIWPVS